jgi:hypothetical protein
MSARLLLLSGPLVVLGLGVAAGRADDARPVEHAEVAPAVTTARDLILRVSTKKAEYTTKEAIPVTVTITNRGPAPVTLVQPGDGSDCGWRTPVIGWSVLPANDEKAAHPNEMPKHASVGRCGNRNPLDPKELFVLRPGETKTVSAAWAGLPVDEGKQRLVFYYRNDPAVKWRGLSGDDPAVLARVKDTFPCLLKSNEITITVKKPGK